MFKISPDLFHAHASNFKVDSDPQQSRLLYSYIHLSSVMVASSMSPRASLLLSALGGLYVCCSMSFAVILLEITQHLIRSSYAVISSSYEQLTSITLYGLCHTIWLKAKIVTKVWICVMGHYKSNSPKGGPHRCPNSKAKFYIDDTRMCVTLSCIWGHV